MIVSTFENLLIIINRFAIVTIYINKELHEFSDIRTGDHLLAYVAEHRKTDARCYLFIDELQGYRSV